MTAAPHLLDKRDWTVGDVESLPEDLHYELINGRLALSSSPMPFHRFGGNEILCALRTRRPREFFLSTDQSILVDSRNEPRPDVVVMRRTGANRTPVLAADVLLVVEVIPPNPPPGTAGTSESSTPTPGSRPAGSLIRSPSALLSPNCSSVRAAPITSKSRRMGG